jgi:hypothetical protein
MAGTSKYTGLGIALGAALGALAGVLVGHIAVWLGLGIAIGMVLGATLRRSEAPCAECVAMHRSHQRRDEETKLQPLSK